MSLELIGRKEYQYNQNITINIPLLKQIRGKNPNEENNFWQEVNLFIITPSDMISELDSQGIDFQTVSEYGLFILLLDKYKEMKPCEDILFKSFNLHELEIKKVGIGEDTRVILADKNGVEIINEPIYNELCVLIADMTGQQRTPPKKFGNEFAKKARIKQDYKNKEKLRKQNNTSKSDFLGSIILRLVCNANFPYDFDTIQDVTIHDLIYSLKQVDKDIKVTDLMQSRLVGNDLSKIPKEELSRFVIQ